MNRFDYRLALATALTAAALGAHATPPAWTSAWVDPVDAPALLMPLAADSLVLSVTRAGERYIAVGAHGDILLSDDGAQWRQVEAPTRATLTAVTAVDAQVWAVGHDGVIVHSADAGAHWQMQRKDPGHAPASDAPFDPRQGAPLLGVLFADAKHGFAVGAYSLALRTDDGGEHWQTMTVAPLPKDDAGMDDDAITDKPVAEESDKQTFSASQLKIGQEPTPHLNAIARTGSGALFIVGERGSAFRSRDNGATWQRLQLPYDGSMFGVIGYAADHVLAFGLRGHVFESEDLGEHWNLLDSGTELSLMGGTAINASGAAIVGTNGVLLMRAKTDNKFAKYTDVPAGTIAAALALGDSGKLLLAGEHGILTYQPQ